MLSVSTASVGVTICLIGCTRRESKRFFNKRSSVSNMLVMPNIDNYLVASRRGSCAVGSVFFRENMSCGPLECCILEP